MQKFKRLSPKPTYGRREELYYSPHDWVGDVYPPTVTKDPFVLTYGVLVSITDYEMFGPFLGDGIHCGRKAYQRHFLVSGCEAEADWVVGIFKEAIPNALWREAETPQEARQQQI